MPSLPRRLLVERNLFDFIKHKYGTASQSGPAQAKRGGGEDQRISIDDVDKLLGVRSSGAVERVAKLHEPTRETWFTDDTAPRTFLSKAAFAPPRPEPRGYTTSPPNVAASGEAKPRDAFMQRVRDESDVACGVACRQFLDTLDRAGRGEVELPPGFFDNREVPVEVRQGAFATYRSAISGPLAREFFGTLYGPAGRARAAGLAGAAARRVIQGQAGVRERTVAPPVAAPDISEARRHPSGRRYAPPTAAERARARAEAQYRDDCDSQRHWDNRKCWDDFGAVFGRNDWRYTGCVDRATERWDQCVRSRPELERWHDSDADNSPRRDPPPRRR